MPDVVPSLFKLLHYPMLSYDVAAMVFSVLTKLIGDTKPEKSKDDQIMTDPEQLESQQVMQETAKQILSDHAEQVCDALKVFWSARSSELKKVISSKGLDRKVRNDDKAAKLKENEMR